MNKDAWYQYFTECEAVTDRNAELVEEKFKECEAYTEKVLKKKYPECGVVFTGHAEAIKAGYFTIWIDTGSVTHKNIKLEDCGIKPVLLHLRMKWLISVRVGTQVRRPPTLCIPDWT